MKVDDKPGFGVQGFKPGETTMKMKSNIKSFSCCLWLWMLRSSYPWGGLLLQLIRLLWIGNERRSRERLRLWRLWLRIDFANLLAIAIDLMQPEFWV